MIARARLTSREAERELAALLDDAVRCADRPDARVSNQAIADACHVTEKRVREWRDPDAPRHLPAPKLLLLPDSVIIALLVRLRARRAELCDVPSPRSVETQAHVTIATCAALIEEISTALLTPGVDPEERRRISARVAGIVRDAERLQAALRELDRHEMPAAGGH